MNNNTCCPKFDPSPWDGKLLEWKDKRFIKGRVRSFFYIPVNFRSVMKQLFEKVEKGKGTVPDSLCLSDHTSRWNMDVYLAVDKEIPEAESTTISGQFLSKVYEGPYRETGRWCKDFEAAAKSRNLGIKRWFMWYTTCPRCAKQYGKNYVVILGQTA
jgi:hypothetical protein